MECFNANAAMRAEALQRAEIVRHFAELPDQLGVAEVAARWPQSSLRDYPCDRPQVQLPRAAVLESSSFSDVSIAKDPSVFSRAKISEKIEANFVRAFSSEVETGSREENASKQESRASVLIQSEPKML
ncbi:hypothetical protein QA635_07275 [Bradyrhizobium brasilense]|uniref:hypothetical protein n=1 Tax=Bradyrhizobium brasilense TaxID=1419277 RepID=UPI0024B18B76|nr:hypothetical protein [Bradyrhizobium australafricanum]WFU37232.1 hypothetical protein QA635_07275 [Bradyrhizobium australafricanum]